MPGSAVRSAALSAPVAGTGTAPRLHHAVQHRPDETVRQHHFIALDHRDIPTAGAGRIGAGLGGGDILRRLAVDRRSDQLIEDPRPVDDGRLLRMSQRHLDHLDAEQRRFRILVRRQPGAPGQLVGRADAGLAGDVDVDVLLVLRIFHHRVGVGAAAGLHVGDVLRIRDIGDVEDPDPAEPVRAHRVAHALGAAVDPAALALTRDEQEILVHRDVALRRGAEILGLEGRLGRVGNIPHLEPVVVALDRVVAGEGEVGIGDPGKLGRLGNVGDDPHVPARLLCGVAGAGAETDPRIRNRRRGACPAGGGRRGAPQRAEQPHGQRGCEQRTKA